MAEIPSIVVGGAIIAYGVHIGFTEPTDHLNQVSLESLLRRRPMGRASLEAWIRAGHFSSSTEAYALLGAYERGLRAWHQGEVPLRADNFPLIENGFFGPLNSGEINSVLRALREIRSETRSADLDRLSGALSERGKEVFREFLRFDALLREEFNQATRELQQQPQGDVDEIFARRIAAALRNDRRWGEGSAYSAERRAILARALDPRVEIAGVSDLAWRARAISALERFSGLSATERSREYGEALRANNQERMQELALVEAARAGVEIRGLSRARDAEVASVLLAQRARNVRTGEAAFPAERLRRARMIDSFCERNDCSDQYETLFRPDFSAFTSVQSFRVGGREISIRNEMDAWEMIFHDPRFLLEAELKARGEDKDVSILTQFLTRLDAHQSLERIQDEVFARSPTQWREDPDAEIPKPAFAQFCRLLGHGRERSPANALFLSTRSTLDQLERTLSRDRFLACRAFLAGLNWDYQASLSHIASRVSSTTNAATRDRVRADMASLREDGAEAFMEAVQACRSNRIKVPPQDALRTLDCENTP